MNINMEMRNLYWFDNTDSAPLNIIPNIWMKNKEVVIKALQVSMIGHCSPTSDK